MTDAVEGFKNMHEHLCQNCCFVIKDGDSFILLVVI